MDCVNERSNWTTTVAFKDQNGIAVTPQTAQYKIEDVGSLAEIRAETELEDLASTVTIKWESTDTRILSQSHPYELRRMTVSWQYLDSEDDPQEGNEQYLLWVRNLPGVPAPETLTT